MYNKKSLIQLKIDRGEYGWHAIEQYGSGAKKALNATGSVTSSPHSDSGVIAAKKDTAKSSGVSIKTVRGSITAADSTARVSGSGMQPVAIPPAALKPST